MFKPHYDVCINCEKRGLIVVKRGLCRRCNIELKSANKKAAHRISEPDEVPEEARSWKRKSPIKVRKKATGELQVFKEIWNERKHICQCCGASVDGRPANFSHILSKGAYPALRLEAQNIMLKCERCHHEWEFGDRSQEKFKLARLIAEKLKRKYYADRTITRHNDLGRSPGNIEG